MKKITLLLLISIISILHAKKFTILAEDTKIIDASFEDGEYSQFEPRGEEVILTVKTDGGSTGKNYLSVSGRTQNWNGVQIPLEKICSPGDEYIVSASVKSEWYSEIMLSMQYTDSEGTDHYDNLKRVISQGSWVTFPEHKFSMPIGVTGVYIYFECSNAEVVLSLDDFVLKTAPVRGIQEDIVSLKEAYSKYFKVGTATTVSEISPKTTQKLVLKHFNSITLGNELKPDALLDKAKTLSLAEETGDYTNPQVKIGSAATILDFCQENDIPVRGHVLVWHSQTPTWFFKEKWDASGKWVDQETMLKRMENYIKNVFEMVKKAYPNIDFYAWDVVNEAWLDDGKPRTGGSQEEGYSNSPWVKIFGDNSFIKYAFKFAKKYVMDGCKLYYNDYNEYISGKTTAIIKMVKELNEEEKLVDGIGLQSHLDIQFPSVSIYEKAIQQFSETGLDLQVTELDATTSDTSSNGFKTQAKYYSDIMDVLVKYSKSISAVVFWGTTDDKSWRAEKCPLLFNGDYTAKDAFYSIVDGLDK